MGIDELFAWLFSGKPEPVHYAQHPPDAVWKALLEGRTRRMRRPVGPAPAGTGAWSRREATVHLLTCKRCRERSRLLKEDASNRHAQGALKRIALALGRGLGPIPRPAVATMAVQFALILGLGGLLLFKGISLAPSAAGGGVTAAEAALPGPAAQAIRTLSQDPDPQERLAAALQLRRWPDPDLVGPLVQVYEREGHPGVREVLEQTLVTIWTSAEDRYLTAVQAFRGMAGSYETAFAPLEHLRSELERFVAGVEVAGSARPVRLTCEAGQELTLEELRQLGERVGGALVVDGLLPPGHFRLQLPQGTQAPDLLGRLEAQEGIRCRP